MGGSYTTGMLRLRASTALLLPRHAVQAPSRARLPLLITRPPAVVHPFVLCALHGCAAFTTEAGAEPAPRASLSPTAGKTAKHHWRGQPHRVRTPRSDTMRPSEPAQKIYSVSRAPRTSSPSASTPSHPSSARTMLESQPKVNISRALMQLVDLSEAGSPSAVGAAVSTTQRGMRAERVPASLQAAMNDDLLRSFDPAPDSTSFSPGAPSTELASFLSGREVIDSPSDGENRIEISGVGEFRPTKNSGKLDSRYELDPDVEYALSGWMDDTALVPGRTETELEVARKSSIQLSLSSLLTTASEYQSRAVERDDALRRSTTSPLSPRTLPNVSARSSSSRALKTRELREMEAVFEVLEARAFPRTRHWTIMIHGYGREGFVADAEKLFSDMLESGLEDARLQKVPGAAFFPDVVTCNAMLGVYANAMKRFTVPPSERAALLEKSRGIFRTMSLHRIQKDIVTYTSMLNLLGNELVRTPVPLERTKLLKEAIELFEYMQTPAGGSLYPNRRTFSVMSQAFAAAGDHTAAKTMMESMVRTHALFPSMAVMNGLLKATAYGCGRIVPVSTSDFTIPSSTKCNVEPIMDVVRMMKGYRMEMTEHSVASVIAGLAQAGQVQTAKDLHDHLADGSLGTAQPSRMTYTALLSAMLEDHTQPMSSVLSTFETALTTGHFKSPVKAQWISLGYASVGRSS